MNKELIVTSEDIELLKEMKDNCLKSDVYDDEKRLLKANAITKVLYENEKNKHYKTLYQSLKKQKEELRSWLKEDNDKIKVYDTKNDKAVELGIVLGLGMCVDKMEELEQPKKELLKPSHYEKNIDVEYELEKARKFIEEDKKRKFGN